MLALVFGFFLIGGQEKPPREPAPPHQVVVVSASRQEQPLLDAVSLVSALPREELDRIPALVLDDHLRSVPGFSLFRRSSSVTAHPTTQGVSLRGIGPSGTSRTLVRFGSVPLNDPFGGWIYWNRFPASLLDQVEVARGAASPLYGSSAMGGVIQILPRRPDRGRVEVRARAADPASWDLELLAADSSGEWGYLVAGRIFDSEGFFTIDKSLRGPVDTRASLEYRTLFGRVFYKDFHAGLNLYQEERSNGTHLQQNRSSLALFESGIARPSWELNFHAQSGILQSTFSRILPDRSREFRTARQRFPSLGAGSSLTVQPAGRLLLGADWRFAEWDDRTQNLAGFFVQNLFTPHPRVDLLLGLRFDLWENRSVEQAWNPRAGVVYRASRLATVRASVYQGFRAPTLNELYRPFRVGNVITQANADLDDERIRGLEGGVDLHPGRGLLLRLNVFWNRLSNPVSNRTLSVEPDLILRQRANIGSISVLGSEAELSVPLASGWALRGAYLYAYSQDDQSQLRTPQVPLHQGNLSLLRRGLWNLHLGAEWVGRQFEDDLNRFALGGYLVFDAMISRAVSDHLELFFAAENILDRAYPVGITPVERLGTPRLLYGGARLRFSY